jgi:hypothetical protein
VRDTMRALLQSYSTYLITKEHTHLPILSYRHYSPPPPLRARACCASVTNHTTTHHPPPTTAAITAITTMTRFLHQFPGLVHFIFVDRTFNRYSSSSSSLSRHSECFPRRLALHSTSPAPSPRVVVVRGVVRGVVADGAWPAGGTVVVVVGGGLPTDRVIAPSISALHAMDRPPDEEEVRAPPEPSPAQPRESSSSLATLAAGGGGGGWWGGRGGQTRYLTRATVGCPSFREIGKSGRGRGGQERNMKRVIKRLVWDMCYDSQQHLSEGAQSVLVKSGPWQYSYRLWVEDVDGFLLPLLLSPPQPYAIDVAGVCVCVVCWRFIPRPPPPRPHLMLRCTRRVSCCLVLRLLFRRRFELIFPPEVPFGTPHVPQTNKFYQKLMHRFFPTRGSPQPPPKTCVVPLVVSCRVCLAYPTHRQCQGTCGAMSCSRCT